MREGALCVGHTYFDPHVQYPSRHLQNRADHKLQVFRVWKALLCGVQKVYGHVQFQMLHFLYYLEDTRALVRIRFSYVVVCCFDNPLFLVSTATHPS